MKIGTFLQSVGSGLKTQNKPEKSTSEILLADYKAGPTSSVQSVFDKYQIKPASEDIKQVSIFMSSAKGTEAEKLQTLDIAMYKGIEPTRDNLMTMHQAIMHDDEVVGALVEVESEPITGDAAKKIIEALKLPAEIKAALKSEIDKGATLKEAVVTVARAINALNSSEMIDIQPKSLAKMIQAIENAVASKPEIRTHFSQIGVNDTSKVPDAPVLNHAHSNQNNSNQASLNEAHPLAEPTKDVPKNAPDNTSEHVSDNTSEHVSKHAPEHISDVKSFKTINPDSAIGLGEVNDEGNDEDKVLLDKMNAMVEALLEHTSATMSTLMETLSLKTYLVETTTEATMQAKATFETFKTETSNLLKAAMAPQNEPALADNLSKVIEKLNQIISKSEVTLFTDMFTEKKLLLMASELDKAQEFTRQGELSKAQTIVKSAIGLLDQIKFNPSQRRVQVFAQNKIGQLADALEKPEKTTIRLDAHIKQQLDYTRDIQGSKMARDVLETMRFLGLNHEMEVAESLEKKDLETVKDWNHSNVKEILLKLMKEDVKDRPIERTEQNLMNLSGQQMMNDSGSKEQPFYFFNLPILDGEELGNMKVYMKGASKGNQMDWKNAELYFGVTLKASGPLGIKVKIQQEKVNIQVMSDDLAAIQVPLNQVMDELESFGFSKGDLSFSSYSKETGIVIKPQLESSKGMTHFANDGKGFDFKI